jgi:hypothetical protein
MPESKQRSICLKANEKEEIFFFSLSNFAAALFCSVITAQLNFDKRLWYLAYVTHFVC